LYLGVSVGLSSEGPKGRVRRRRGRSHEKRKNDKVISKANALHMSMAVNVMDSY